MKKILIISFIFGIFSCSEDRVHTARTEKINFIHQKIAQNGIDGNQFDIFLRAFKEENKMEVWAKNKSDSIFKNIIDYDFCTFSGDLGPKRKSGDKQIPEGIYFIQAFNPKSDYYLSMGINYPNAADSILGFKENLGNDIYIHGDCVSVGCIAITDDKIKELYTFADIARASGQTKIRVEIYPFKFSENDSDIYKKYPQHQKLWDELKVFYNAFEKSHKTSFFTVDTEGEYHIQ
jgi:murein L,D-transpeptidase YafK